MRLPDLRQWNILGSAALLALTACGPDAASLEAGDGETGDGDASGDGDADGTGDGDSGTPLECVLDGDCPIGYDCTTENLCEPGYSCGQPLPQHPGSVADDPVHPRCRPPWQCYEDDECGVGESCEHHHCVPAQLPGCEAPALIEIPLPAIDGPILDLQFVDLDDDGDDELVLLAADRLIVVDGDLSAAELGPFEPVGDQLTALRANDDDTVDLLISSSEFTSGLLWLNVDGELGSAPGGPGTAVRRPLAIDWPTGGGQELLALSPGDNEARVFATLDGPPPSFASFPERYGTIDDLDVGRFDGLDAIVTSEQCTIMVRSQAGDPQVFPSQAGAPCPIAVAQINGAPTYDIASLTPDGALVLIRDLSFPVTTLVSGSFTDLVGLELDGDYPSELLLYGASAPTLIRVGPEGPDCQAALPELPSATSLVVGDLDGDGEHEFALRTGEGQVRLFDRG